VQSSSRKTIDSKKYVEKSANNAENTELQK